MEKINFINKIKSFDSNEFVEWYISMIEFNLRSTVEENLFASAITDGSSNRFYKLFNHLEHYDPKKTSPYQDLISLVKDEYDLFVTKCKQVIIKKLGSDIFLLRFKRKFYDDKFELIVHQIKKENLDIDTIFFQYEIIGPNIPLTDFVSLMVPNQLINLKLSSYSGTHIGIEFVNAGIQNHNFINLEYLQVSKYF